MDYYHPSLSWRQNCSVKGEKIIRVCLDDRQKDAHSAPGTSSSVRRAVVHLVMSTKAKPG